jgi:hypothetical protein
MKVRGKYVARLWRMICDPDQTQRRKAYLEIIGEWFSHDEIVALAKRALDRQENKNK